MSEDIVLSPMWTQKEAIDLIAQHIRPVALKHGFYVGLGGSVLYKGSSDNDLDVILAPLSGVEISPYAVENIMIDLTDAINLRRYGVATKDRKPEDKIVVCAWDSTERAIDFFFPTFIHKDRIDAVPNVEDLNSDY